MSGSYIPKTFIVFMAGILFCVPAVTLAVNEVISDPQQMADILFSFNAVLNDVKKLLDGFNALSTQAQTSDPSVSVLDEKFIIGDRAKVQTGDALSLNVRRSPQLSNNRLGSHPNGVNGTIINGPVFVDGFWWWEIDYDVTPDGWSVEDFLKNVTVPPSSPADSSIPSSSTADIPASSSASNPSLPVKWVKELSGDAATPVIADLDGDGNSEVIITTLRDVYVLHYDGSIYQGWPVSLGVVIGSPAAVADIDNDGDLEIIITSRKNTIYAYHHTGKPVDGWPQQTGDGFPNDFWAPAAIGDIDSDGDLEIAAGLRKCSDQFYVWHHDGTIADGFPKTIPNYFNGSVEICSRFGNASLADLDADGTLEIIVVSDNAFVYIWRFDGSNFPGWPKKVKRGGHVSYPVIGDIDGDGNLDIIAGFPGNINSGPSIYAWRSTGELFPGWPQFLTASIPLGEDNILYSSFFSHVALGDIDQDGRPEVVIGEDLNGKMYAWNHNGSAVPGWPTITPTYRDCSLQYKDIITDRGYRFRGQSVIADIDGDGEAEIIAAGGTGVPCQGEVPGKLFAWNVDGSYVPGWPKDWKESPLGAIPEVVDLDNDGIIEVVFLYGNSILYVLDGGSIYNPDANEWSKLQSDIQFTGTYKGIRSTASSTTSMADISEISEGLISFPAPSAPIENQPPIVHAGIDVTVTDNDNDGIEKVTLNGVAIDLDGEITDYQWSIYDVIFDEELVFTSNFGIGTFTLTFAVTDDDGATSSDDVIVQVKPFIASLSVPILPPSELEPSPVPEPSSTSSEPEPKTPEQSLNLSSSEENQPPFVNAGLDKVIVDADGDGFEELTFKGTASDADGTVEKYQWIFNGVILTTDAVLTSRFNVGNHTLTFIVIDNEGAPASDEVLITVYASASAPSEVLPSLGGNQLPMVDAGPDQTVTDSDNNGFETLTLTGTASDADGTIQTYKWLSGSTVLASNALFTFKFSVGTHTLTLRVTDDDGGSASDQITIIIEQSPDLKFVVNDNVRVKIQADNILSLNVRSSPELSNNRIGAQPEGAEGIITGGPVFADEFWWWHVDYKNAPDGWSAEDFLEIASN